MYIVHVNNSINGFQVFGYKHTQPRRQIKIDWIKRIDKKKLLNIIIEYKPRTSINSI